MNKETKEQIQYKLSEIFNLIENNHNQDEVLFMIDRLIKNIDKIPEEQPQVIQEQKDSIKITKNTKGYNYEFKIVAKDGIDLLEQINYTQAELERKTKEWSK